jgi:hypothetical protein
LEWTKSSDGVPVFPAGEGLDREDQSERLQGRQDGREKQASKDRVRRCPLLVDGDAQARKGG